MIGVQPAVPSLRRLAWLPCAAIALALLAGCSSASSGDPTRSNWQTYADDDAPTAPVRAVDPTRVPAPTPTRRPAPPTTAPVTELHFFGMRTVGGYTPAMSLECYTFYPGGQTVEIRHGGRPTPSDVGTYQGDERSGWRITWQSRRSSTVVADGEAALRINGARMTQIESCMRV